MAESKYDSLVNFVGTAKAEREASPVSVGVITLDKGDMLLIKMKFGDQNDASNPFVGTIFTATLFVGAKILGKQTISSLESALKFFQASDLKELCRTIEDKRSIVVEAREKELLSSDGSPAGSETVFSLAM